MITYENKDKIKSAKALVTYVSIIPAKNSNTTHKITDTPTATIKFFDVINSALNVWFFAKIPLIHLITMWVTMNDVARDKINAGSSKIPWGRTYAKKTCKGITDAKYPISKLLKIIIPVDTIENRNPHNIMIILTSTLLKKIPLKVIPSTAVDSTIFLITSTKIEFNESAKK